MNMTLESSKAELHKMAEKIREGIASGKYTMQEVQASVVDKSKRAAAVTDAYVHENAWKAVGVAALAGLVVGAIIASSSDEDEISEEQLIVQPVVREPKVEKNFNILELLQTAMPLALFAFKTYNKVQQRRRSVPVM
ncbi:MAG TPA: hypothetical protein VEH27_10240 [Methylomirabilota bacterium]|nr:hypothetical protein [Methylomirabilota bacterium]